MVIKTIKVTNKGQIFIPIDIQESCDIKQGDELIISESDNAIILRKINKDDFSDLLKHSEKVAEKLWSNTEDEIWNTI